ncbi:MAG: phosphopyruvate hydratase [Microgenomates group bacterium]|nr:phosphopyruvate hydratase [Microgenomates group bacterium]
MGKIKAIKAYEIIDSRSYPTLEGSLTLDNGIEVFTSIPAGTSIGKSEAVELRDKDQTRLEGMGVSTAVSYVNDLIAPKLIGVSPLKQKEVDYWLIQADGTKNKSNLGSNTTLLISQLFIKAAAADLGVPLFKYINSYYNSLLLTDLKIKKIPTPIFNLINGGKHANNNLEFQEFQLIPSSSFSFSKSYILAIEIFHELKRVLKYRNANISVGEEGGFTPNFTTNIDALEVLYETLVQKELNPGVDAFFGIDFAASNFYKNERYTIKDKPHPLKADEYINFLHNLIKSYPFLILEDPLSEEDWGNWIKFNAQLSPNIYLVGDDLLTTNKERLLKAVKNKACSAILIKPNQIGTITETIEVIDTARRNNFSFIVSHRSGETNDSFIADFSVGVQADFVKFGAPSRGERVAKYNRLWQIERDEIK